MKRRPSAIIQDERWEKNNLSSDLRVCDYEGCQATGTYQAPKHRNTLRDYYWFCLAHVQAYNRKWDYYAHMSPGEIEESRFLDKRWERGTQPFHGNITRFLNSFYDPLNLMGSKEKRDKEEKNSSSLGPYLPNSEEAKALKLFKLSYPFQEHLLKRRYKELVKKFHPDVKGGNPSSDETMKRINHAYTLLKKISGTT